MRVESTGREHRVAIYTALFGDYDALPEPVPQDIPVEWICFTDDPTLRSHTWQIVHASPRYSHPRMSAKWYKAVPHLALPEHRQTIWVDANMRVDSPAFAREALSFASAGIAVFRHPHRDCVYREAQESQRTAPEKYHDQPIKAQMESYRKAGHPAHAGLYALGTIVRDRDLPLVRELGEQWLRECETWSYQDQLSFPVVAARLGLQPVTFPHHLHRHGIKDGVTCALHRFSWFDRLAEVRRGARPVAGPIPEPGAIRRRPRWPRSNPWWELIPHRSCA